jgi:putative membrane-bound dehydrogenase-like protein
MMNATTIKDKNYLFVLTCVIFLASCQTKKNETPEGFEINPDFNLELVASEPLVFDPVDMQFDEEGRTYVLEMPGYPLGDLESRLVELIDSNNDGVYDRRRLMDDELGPAASFMPYKEGFLVASPPNLLWIADTDNDGTIDKRETLLSGFSSGNLQHNYNGLTYGIDNWIYAANGGNSGKPFFIDSPENAKDLRETDLKFNLEKRLLAPVGSSSEGFKLTFDNWGDMFETHNTQHIHHLVFEDRYLENLPVSPPNALSMISDHEENGLARIYPIGEQESRMNHPEQSGYFSGACGITYYGGGAFPKGYNSIVLVADCVLNLVHLDVLTPDGSSFKASRLRDKVEFLASKDRSFRPVNLSVGPDGALFVIDMHRKVIEHPEWIPDELEAKMDLNAGKDEGRIYKITPKTNWSPGNPKLKADDAEKLTKALGNPNQWTRNTAQRVLVTNKMDAAVPFLNDLLDTSKNPLAKLHCLWTLEGLGKLGVTQLQKALQDSSSRVRENAIRIAELHLAGETGLVDNIISLTKDPNERVRMQAALTLSTLTKENYLKFSAAIREAMLKLMSDTSNDIWSIEAIAAALKQQALPFMIAHLKSEIGSLTPIDLDISSILIKKIGKGGDLNGLLQVIGAIHDDNLDNYTRVKLVEALENGWEEGSNSIPSPNAARNMTTAIGLLESGSDVNLIRATGQLRRAMGLPASGHIKGLMISASKWALDQTLSSEKRMEQLQLLALENFDRRKEILYKLLDNTQPISLQKEALSQLGAINNPSVGKKLLELWPGLGPEARRTATDILLYRSFNHDQLLTAMEKKEVSLGEFNLDLERRRVLLDSDDENISNRAKALFSDVGVVERRDAIEKMRPALSIRGDATGGKEVFEAYCAQCHTYGNIGKLVGPVLTEVNRKSKESLMQDILDPNAAVNTQFLSYQVKTKDGSIMTGLIYHETDNEIGLRMIGGIEKIIPKSNIDKISSLGKSLMFEGFESNLSVQDMADLLTFLQSAK